MIASKYKCVFIDYAFYTLFETRMETPVAQITYLCSAFERRPTVSASEERKRASKGLTLSRLVGSRGLTAKRRKLVDRQRECERRFDGALTFS